MLFLDYIIKLSYCYFKVIISLKMLFFYRFVYGRGEDNMQECHEYFDCKHTECIKRYKNNTQCWEIEETLCSSEYIERLKIFLDEQYSNQSKCDFCSYSNAYRRN
jgi:hypothetical protein